MNKCIICGGKHHAKNYCTKHYKQFSRHGKILERTRFSINKIIDRGNYYEMELYNKKQEVIALTKFSKNQIEKVEKIKWCLSSWGYAHNIKITMHRLIKGDRKGLVVDHINRNKLDNRNENLRHTTQAVNSRNRDKRPLGVHWAKRERKWVATIEDGFKKYYLGFFDNLILARLVRLKAEQLFWNDDNKKL
jgi:hypothetical protein